MGEEIDFKEVYKEFRPKIVHYISRLAGPNDAEDIAQDVFDKISRSLGGFRGKSKLSTWIYRIATNTTIDRMRSATYKHTKGHSAIENVAGLDSDNADNAHTPAAIDQTLIRKEMSECVIEFIDDLPPDHRTVIVLSELEGLANNEIADILDISLENVKVRLHRARARLRAALNDGCEFYHNEQSVLACDRKPSQILPKPIK